MKKEVILVEMLLFKFFCIVSCEDLLVVFWDDESFVEENILNVNIICFCKKFNEFGIENFIEIVCGFGYCFNVIWSE